jgi:hypothetical protein
MHAGLEVLMTPLNPPKRPIGFVTPEDKSGGRKALRATGKA